MKNKTNQNNESDLSLALFVGSVAWAFFYAAGCSILFRLAPADTLSWSLFFIMFFIAVIASGFYSIKPRSGLALSLIVAIMGWALFFAGAVGVFLRLLPADWQSLIMAAVFCVVGMVASGLYSTRRK